MEGFYGLLRGAISHSSLPTSSPPPKKACCAPSAIVSHPSPQESKEPEASAPVEQALESAYLTIPPVLEEEIPAHMHSLCIQLGASKGCTDVRLRAAKRVHLPLVLPSVPMCERYIWEWGWCAPSVASLYLILIPSGITGKVIPTCRMGNSTWEIVSKWWVGSNSRSVVIVILLSLIVI